MFFHLGAQGWLIEWKILVLSICSLSLLLYFKHLLLPRGCVSTRAGDSRVDDAYNMVARSP